MNRQETLAYLDRVGIGYELTEHKAVYNMAEVDLPYPHLDAKNLFVRDDKRLGYCLITVRGEKRVNLKEFRKQHGTRPLTFAPEEELLDLLGLTPGAVTPWACRMTPPAGSPSIWTRTSCRSRGSLASTPMTTPPPSG